MKAAISETSTNTMHNTSIFNVTYFCITTSW